MSDSKPRVSNISPSKVIQTPAGTEAYTLLIQTFRTIKRLQTNSSALSERDGHKNGCACKRLGTLWGVYSRFHLRRWKQSNLIRFLMCKWRVCVAAGRDAALQDEAGKMQGRSEEEEDVSDASCSLGCLSLWHKLQLWNVRHSGESGNRKNDALIWVLFI